MTSYGMINPDKSSAERSGCYENCSWERDVSILITLGREFTLPLASLRFYPWFLGLSSPQVCLCLRSGSPRLWTTVKDFEY